MAMQASGGDRSSDPKVRALYKSYERQSQDVQEDLQIVLGAAGGSAGRVGNPSRNKGILSSGDLNQLEGSIQALRDAERLAGSNVGVAGAEGHCHA